MTTYSVTAKMGDFEEPNLVRRSRRRRQRRSLARHFSQDPLNALLSTLFRVGIDRRRRWEVVQRRAGVVDRDAVRRKSGGKDGFEQRSGEAASFVSGLVRTYWIRWV
jgi:hypothetical protein